MNQEIHDRLEKARAQRAKAKRHLDAVNEAGYDARPELGLPPDATAEQVRAGIEAKYPDPHRPPFDSWAGYMWASKAAEFEVMRASRQMQLLAALQVLTARGVPEEEARREIDAAMEAG